MPSTIFHEVFSSGTSTASGTEGAETSTTSSGTFPAFSSPLEMRGTGSQLPANTTQNQLFFKLVFW